MYKTIEKLRGWVRPGAYVTKQDLGVLIHDLEVESMRRTNSDFKEALERADLAKENKALKVQIKDLQDRNNGLRIQKQILDNIAHVGYHPDYVQSLKDQIEELNVKLAKEKIKGNMYQALSDLGAVHPNHVQDLKSRITKLKCHVEVLKKHLDQALMYKAAGTEKEVEALQQINAAILDVVAAQKDYTHKLEAALGAWGATRAEVEKPPGVESRGTNKDFW